ncbi:hypothetical protein [Sphingomonas sp.]|uniref:hypothetical protein n=1 Tax=Sphingomonas sp. TaxID=28214 RepID=UPI003AFFC3C8
MTESRPKPAAAPHNRLDRTRDAAGDAARRTIDGIEANPLGIVVGGLAVGVLAGALLPRSAREKELLAPVGRRLGETARAALDTAKAQGLSELESRGFTRDAAREQVKNLIGGLGQAAANAGTAAAKSATGRTDDA